MFQPNSKKEDRLFVKGIQPKFNLEHSVHLVVEKRMKALSVHLFVDMKLSRLEEVGTRLSLEAWPVSGSSVGCLLKKQAPGPGEAVDACGSGYAPARFLILILYMLKHTHTPAHTHTHTSPHTDTRFPRGGRGLFAQKGRC